MPVVTMRQLLEAGIHFGHQTRRWNPKMARYIFGQRNGIYIIDLQKTLRQVHLAYAMVRDKVAAGGTVLFVGTKKQAQEAAAHEAQRCGMFYVNSRWLGGTLTNWETIQKSIRALLRLEEMDASGKLDEFPKKEAIKMRKECVRLNKNLAGIKNMPGVPNVLFVIDAKKENIAVQEAKRLGIVCIGVVDTNCDPDVVDIAIPGNDDALRAVSLFCSVMADAVMDGRMQQDKYLADGGAQGRRGGRPSRGKDVEAAMMSKIKEDEAADGADEEE
ncbi:MAG: small subunit ribosomal protein [Candidatus Hydrogenedentes bacterium]|nr:small subunit ribosomal protein [Candidatus Hydrogenedentota bacterium]